MTWWNMRTRLSSAAAILAIGSLSSARLSGQMLPPAQGYHFMRLDAPGSAQTSGYGISNSGQIVGAYIDALGDRHGFIYNGGVFNVLAIPGAPDAVPTGINSAGTFVGSYTDASSTSRAFIDQAGVFSPYVRAGLADPDPLDINDVGDIIGSTSGREGFVDFRGNNLYLYSFGTGVKFFPRGIATGEVSVGYYLGYDGFFHGFITDGGVPFVRFFDVPGATDTFAEDFNALNFGLGTMVGTYWENVGGTRTIHGFVWEHASLPYGGDEFFRLDVPGAYRTEASGINDAGQIVGTYYDETGQHAFVTSTATPEPGTLALFAIGLIGVARLRRRYPVSHRSSSYAWSR